MPDLPKRPLGRTGVLVTPIGFGAMELREPGRVGLDLDGARRLLHAVLDSGINFIDTSPDYGPSEDLIGEAIAGRREEYVLATKCGCPVDSSSWAAHLHDFSRRNIRRGVEQSLRRLRTDYLDIVQIHLSPSREVLESNDSIAELRLLQREGKVRFIGMSGTLPNLNEQIAMGCFDVFQVPYSAIEPSHGDAMSRAGNSGAGIIVRGGIWRGMDHVGVGLPRRAWSFVKRLLGRGDVWEAAKFDQLLDGMSVIEFLLRFTLSHPAQSTTIVGTGSSKHLADNVAAASKGPLPREVFAEANRRLREVERLRGGRAD